MSVSFEQRYATPDIADIATRGAGLTIVRPDGKIWVQQDVGGKAETGREHGRASIAFETQKIGESHYRNVLGAFPEVINDTILPFVAGHFHTTDNLASTPRLQFSYEGKTVDYAVAVVVYDGPDIDFQPHVTEEASPLGWMRPESLLAMEEDEVRPLARDAVSHLTDNGILDSKIADFHERPYGRALVIPKGFVVAEFHEQRELVSDMKPGIFYSMQ